MTKLMEKLSVKHVICLHKEKTSYWHTVEPSVASSSSFLRLVEGNHKENFLLWHEEDKARREDAGFQYVYQAKRNIDKHNQTRNDFIEKMDAFIYEMLPAIPLNTPLHTETPGMIVDRLSILALKEYHMNDEVNREDALEAHREQCSRKLAVIQEQLIDLAKGLEDYFQDLQTGKRGFKRYFQFKMYNNPQLNPQLYSQRQKV